MYARALSVFVQYMSVCDGLGPVRETVLLFNNSKSNSELDKAKGPNPQRLK
jgi:hypothetical protein